MTSDLSPLRHARYFTFFFHIFTLKICATHLQKETNYVAVEFFPNPNVTTFNHIQLLSINNCVCLKIKAL